MACIPVPPLTPTAKPPNGPPSRSSPPNEQAIHRWLAQSTRPRLTIEASWPSRPEPVGRVLLQAMMLAGRDPVDVRAARVIVKRDASRPHGFAVHATFPMYL
jgi:hypothetical protein